MRDSIGSAMHARALRDHLYESRAKLVDIRFCEIQFTLGADIRMSR